MRAGLSTIQQTLTPEAATVLNHSIAEASRRNHGQTTPLHVAATLLSSPSGYLRQACIRSHPNSSHPLQCRALELCFSVALERLPTAQNMLQGTEPPISNALMAALKRAQAHQRRGCPEQQQQPLLAVKVELEQLIISILDDPSVSRVMREASFSSPAVKNTIEQSLTQTSSSSQHHQTNINLSPFTAMGGGSRIIGANPVTPVQVTRNMYLNPKLQGGGGGGGVGIGGQLGSLQRGEEVKKVLEILLRSKKKNPVLVGEGEPESVVKELFNKIEKGELSEGHLKNLQIVQMDKEFSFSCDKIQMLNKIKELEGVIESKMSNGSGGVILDLGDLKWLVEQQQQPMISEIGKAAVAEMGKLLARFREDNSNSSNNNNRLWLIGTATCETYLRCQVYHSTMENDWDLQAVPIASRSPHPGIFPRLGNERVLGSSLDPLNPLKSFAGPVPSLPRRVPENLNPRLRTSCCPQCKEKFEHELAKLASEFENSSSEAKSESPPRPQLPQWLQSAKLKNDSKATALSQIKDQGLLLQKTQELQKKWNDTCLQLHPNFQHSVGLQRTIPPVLSMPGLYNPNLLLRQPLQPKLVPSRSLGVSLQLNTTQTASQSPEKVATPPGSPVRTDLVLGPKPSGTGPEKTLEDQAKDFLSCISSVPQNKLLDKFASALDADTFKRLLKGLMEKAWWQQDAASSVASAVSRCRLGNGKQRGGAPKGDIWLLFTGPDRYAKRKMASVLAEQMCGNSPIMISLGSRRDDEESDVGFRGKTAVDRIAEAVRRHPLSVIMLEDIDEANVLVRGSIKRAMDRGRLTDSHGREISLGNVIFILTGNWSTMSPESYRNEYLMEEKKLVSLASSDWQLRLTVGEKSAKRRASWLHDQDRPRKELNLGLSFDLNEAAEFEDYRTDGSHNSSDLTVEREEDPHLENRRFSVTSVPHELVSSADDTIPFKPIEFLFARREIKKTISKKFSMVIVDDKVSIEVEDEIVDRILGGLWRGRTSLEQWVEKVLGPSFDQIQPRLPSSDENTIVRLQLELLHTDSNSHNNGECLPSKVTILEDGQ